MKKTLNTLLFMLCGVVFFAFALGSGNESEVKTSNELNSDAAKKSSELSTYRINEDIYVTASDGQYRLKFTNVSETSDRNQFSDIQADRVILVEFEYENISADSDLSITGSLNMKAYDKDNNRLETYPATEQKYGGAVSQGRKTTSIEAYALNNQANYIEVEFYNDIFGSKPNCKIILEW